MRHIVIAIIFLHPLILFAQSQGETSSKAADRAISEIQISDLHDGSLLVRLFTQQNKIDALMKVSANEKAEKVRQEQHNLNKEIVRAFQQNFTFCNVYFFFSHDSKFVLSNQLSEIEFLDTNLLPDPSIKIIGSSFLTAEIGHSEQMGFGALIIKDDQFNQLKKPFPFYVRNFNSMPFRRKNSTVVEMMNVKLHDYYRQNSTPIE